MVEATVYRKMYEAQNVAREPEDPELTLRPDMKKTLISKKSKKYYHNGLWQEMKTVGKDGKEKSKWSWSCCMNSDQTSEGCVAVIVDKEKWILSS